ncbi:hypothetical protein DPMN_041359 [Dreissena polymorpha]|uniref:Uncharacterized protein n=1 Tax=Dreissena polymorpha TaxID=45954 RepID=A0A9D4CWS6_DREPO|nr:hypothetical protein DPMN_041359 [Dreissena polymorpha]
MRGHNTATDFSLPGRHSAWLNILILITSVAYCPLFIVLKKISKFTFENNEFYILVTDPPKQNYMTTVQNGGPFRDGTQTIDVIGRNPLELSAINGVPLFESE